MKKKSMIIMGMLVSMVTTLQSQIPGRTTYKRSEISLISFQRLVINAAIDIVLVQNDTLTKAIIEGDDKSVDGITLFIARGTMTISGKEASYEGSIKATIPVSKTYHNGNKCGCEHCCTERISYA